MFDTDQLWLTVLKKPSKKKTTHYAHHALSSDIYIQIHCPSTRRGKDYSVHRYLPSISGARTTCLVLSVFRGMSEDHNRRGGVDARPRNMEVNGVRLRSVLVLKARSEFRSPEVMNGWRRNQSATKGAITEDSWLILLLYISVLYPCG